MKNIYVDCFTGLDSVRIKVRLFHRLTLSTLTRGDACMDGVDGSD